MTDIPGMPYDGVTDVIDESGNGKGVALNVWPADNRIPVVVDPIPLDTVVLVAGELAYAKTTQRLRVGDGYTAGGDEIAFTSDLDNLLADVVTSFNARKGAITLTSGDVTTALTYVPATKNVFTSSVAGLAPASGGGSANFLCADGTWKLPAGGGLSDGDKGDVVVSAGGTVLTVESAAGNFVATGRVSAVGVNVNRASVSSSAARNPGVYVFTNGSVDYGMEIGFAGGTYVTRVFAGPGQPVTIGGVAGGGANQSDFTDYATFSPTGLVVAGTVTAAGGNMTGELNFKLGANPVDGSIRGNAAGWLLHKAQAYEWETQAGVRMMYFISTGNPSLTIAGPVDSAPSFHMQGQNPTIYLEGDANSYFPGITFSGAAGAGNTGTIANGGFGFSFGTKQGNYIFSVNNVNALVVDIAGINAKGSANYFGPAAGDPIADSALVIRTTNYYPELIFQTANGGAVGTPLVDCGKFSTGVAECSYRFASHSFKNKDASVSFATIDANGITVPDEAYGAAWDGKLSVPTKNAVYDKINSLAIPAAPTSQTIVSNAAVVVAATDTIVTVSALAVGTTITAANGSVNGQKCTILVRDNGVTKSVALSAANFLLMLGAATAATAVTTANKWLGWEVVWSTTVGKWLVVKELKEF